MPTIYSFDKVVNDFYLKNRNEFINLIHWKFPQIGLDEIEDIYQNAFLAAYDNLQAGKVQEETKWKSYIFAIGSNMVLNVTKKSDLMVELPDEVGNNNESDIIGLLGDDSQIPEEGLETMLEEMALLPQPCETILKDFYFLNFSMEQITAETGYNNADTMKAKKSQCYKKLCQRVISTFKLKGISLFNTDEY